MNPGARIYEKSNAEVNLIYQKFLQLFFIIYECEKIYRICVIQTILKDFCAFNRNDAYVGLANNERFK